MHLVIYQKHSYLVEEINPCQILHMPYFMCQYIWWLNRPCPVSLRPTRVAIVIWPLQGCFVPWVSALKFHLVPSKSLILPYPSDPLSVILHVKKYSFGCSLLSGMSHTALGKDIQQVTPQQAENLFKGYIQVSIPGRRKTK